MLYSVWNSGAQRYDYYQAPGQLRDGVFAPNAQLSGGGELGLAPDDAARPLPAGATLVGHGELAQGVIASRKHPLGFLGIDNDSLKLAGMIGGAYLIYKVVIA